MVHKVIDFIYYVEVDGDAGREYSCTEVNICDQDKRENVAALQVTIFPMEIATRCPHLIASRSNGANIFYYYY